MLRTATPFVAPNRALCYLLFLAVAVLAHGDDVGHGMKMDMDGGGGGGGGGSDGAGEHSSNNNGPTPSDGSSPMSYFAYQEHAGSIVAHIVLMVIAWFFILPIGTHIIKLKLYSSKKKKKKISVPPPLFFPFFLGTPTWTKQKLLQWTKRNTLNEIVNSQPRR